MREEVKNSIIKALRNEFDDSNTSRFRLVQILETAKRLGFYDCWKEMKDDLILMEVINDDNFNTIGQMN